MTPEDEPLEDEFVETDDETLLTEVPHTEEELLEE